MLWFIDNSAAELALVKAGSPTETMCQIALLATAALAALRARPWFEHVASADNPADPLSRDGYEDVNVAAHVRAGEWEVFEPIEPPLAALRFEHLWQTPL